MSAKRPWAAYAGRELPVLDERVEFEVPGDDSYGAVLSGDFGPVAVSIDPSGVVCHFTGDVKDEWRIGWTELRHVIRTKVQFERDAKAHEEEIKVFRVTVSEFHAERDAFDNERRAARGDAKLLAIKPPSKRDGAA